MAYEELIEPAGEDGTVRIRRLESVEEVERYRLPADDGPAIDWDLVVAENLIQPPVTVDDVARSSTTAYRGLLRVILREALDESTLEAALG